MGDDGNHTHGEEHQPQRQQDDRAQVAFQVAQRGRGRRPEQQRRDEDEEDGPRIQRQLRQARDECERETTENQERRQRDAGAVGQRPQGGDGCEQDQDERDQRHFRASADDLWGGRGQCGRSSTMRPSTLPLRRSASTWLMAPSGARRMWARTLPSAANCSASARSLRVPTIEPRMVMRLRTTSTMRVSKLPGGSPTKATVPLRRTRRSAWVNALGDTAVTSTPCAPPPVSFMTCRAASGAPASMAASAPRERASASLPSLTSSATTCSPMARAYCSATCPSPPIPQTASHSPGRTSVSLIAL